MAARVPVVPKRDRDLARARDELRDGGDDEWRLIRNSSEND
jgi:hypothetical protein